MAMADELIPSIPSTMELAVSVDVGIAMAIVLVGDIVAALKRSGLDVTIVLPSKFVESQRVHLSLALQEAVSIIKLLCEHL